MKVLQSLHNLTQDQCVDVFVRADGSFGYDEYRRDYEDSGGWFSLNRYSHLVFDTQANACKHAQEIVTWVLAEQ
ncbi:MAG: hypothetical protein ACI9FR_002599 [Cryomorphaceae bacterium]|jgi:hypothetical protein